MTLLKGGIFVTLNQLLNELHLQVNYPLELGNLTIKNEALFCRYALLKYFESEKFQDDLDNCFADYLSVSDSFSVCLLLNRSTNLEFSILLEVEF